MLNLQYNRESERKDVPVDGEGTAGAVFLDGGEARPGASPAIEGMFAGVCEFCGQSIKPFPSLEQQSSKSPEELYCCDDYREFVQFMITHPLHEKYTADKMIDIAPHPPHGSKQARRAAKERAAQRYVANKMEVGLSTVRQ